MGNLKEDIKNYLEENLENCPKIFLDYMGEEIENGILILEYGSSLTKVFDYGLYARNIQITVKGNKGSKAEKLAYSIFEILNSGLTEEERQITLTENRKVICRPKQLPFFIKKTEAGSSFYSFNLIIHTTGF